MRFLLKGQKRALVIFIAFLLSGLMSSCTSILPTMSTPPVSSIRVVMDTYYPPYIFLDEQGTPRGILVDQWALWEQRTGVKAELYPIAWDEALAGMEEGKYDVIDTIFYTKERAEVYDFTAAYAPIDVPIFFNNNISGIAEVNDLKGFRVAVKAGDADAEFVEKAGIKDLVYYESYEEIVQAAARGEENVFVIDQPPGLYYLYKYGLQDQFNYSEPLFSGAFHRAVKKGDTAILSLVEEGFDSISPNEYQEIQEHWLGVNQNSRWQKYLPYFMPVALVAFLSILLLIVFNRTLRRRVNQRTGELNEALASLQKSERKYREIFNATTEAIFVHAMPDGRLLHVNESMLRMYGYDTEEEVLSSNAADLNLNIPPYTLFDAQEKLRKAFEEGPQIFEWLAKRKSGETFWTEVSLRYSQIAGEGHVLAVVQDINERKQSEQSLRDRERQYRTLIEQIPAIAYVDDISNGIHSLYIGPQVERILGYTPQEWLGQSLALWVSLLHPDDRETVRQKYMNCVEKGEPFEAEYRIRTANGQLLWLHDQAVRLCDEDGKPQALHGVMQDITSQKQAEHLLREKEREYRTLVEQIPAIVYVDDVGNGLRPLYIGPQIEQILGYTQQAWLETAHSIWYSSLHPDDRETVYAQYIRCAEKGVPFNEEYRISTVDGRLVWLHDQAVLLRDENGNPQLLHGVMQDITEQKHSEEKIRQRVMELETLYESGLAINQLLDPNEIGKKVIELLEKKLGWNHTTVCLYHPQDESLELLAFNQPGLRTEEERREVGERFKSLVAYASQGVSGWAVRHKQVVRSNDLPNDPRYVDTYPGLQSGLYVPLLIGDRTVGVISIESEQPNAFSLEDERLVATLANQVASALENARLFEAERKQRLVSDALRDALRAGASMSTSLDFETILDHLLEALERIVPFEGGAVMLTRSGKSSIARMRGYKKLDGNGIRTILKRNLEISSVENLRWMFDNKQPMVIPDVDQYPGWIHYPETSHIRSWAGAPIVVDNEVIAYFSLDSAEPNFFTEDDLELMRAFTGQASLALQNARLFKETELRFKEFAALYEISNALSAENDLNTLLKDIVEHARSLLGAATGIMYLLNPKNNNLEIVVSTTPLVAVGTIQRLGEGMAGRVAQSRQPMRLENYSDWEDRLPMYDNASFRADLEVPILFGGDLIGVLDVAEMGASTRLFTESDERLLSLFATQAAGLLHSARLREETARRADEFASLYETSRIFSGENDLNTMLQVIVEHARQLLHASSSGIYLYLAENDELVLTADTTPYLIVGTRLRLGEGAAGYVAQTRQSLRLDDYSTWEGRSLQYDDKSIHAILEVPMFYGGELIGVLTVDETSDSERKFTEDDEHLLSLFASQAAGAIHSARLREQTGRQLRQLQALHLIDRAISSSFDLRPILNTVIDQTISQLDVDAVDVLLYHPHLQMLDYVAGRGFRTRAIEKTRLRLGECFSGRAAFERRTVHVASLPDAGSSFTRADILQAEGFLELYSVPLIAKGQVKGVLEAFHRSALPTHPDWIEFLETLAGQAAITIDQTQLFEDLQRANLELVIAYDATIEGWARAMDLRDKETESHTERVTELTVFLARALGVKDGELIHIRRGALLHDIGKMGVPDNILLKEGTLTEEEWSFMQRHPQFAYEMLQPVKYLRQSLDIPYCHHEKWDGTGYPRGLKGGQIPISARIFSVVDVWDALTSDRPYRKAWTKKKALAHIREQSGKQFDPKIVEAFLEVFENEDEDSS